MTCCGAFYCKSCLARITSSCELSHITSCRQKNKNNHFSDNKSNERIQTLMVKCTNSDEGCDWTGELKDLDDHRSQCPKETIPCTLSEVGCETRLLRENLDEHIAQDQQQHLNCAVASILSLRQELATCMDEVRTLPVIIKMTDFAEFRNTGDVWYSTAFYSRRSECRLRLCVWIQSEHPSRFYCSLDNKVSVALELLCSRTSPWQRQEPISLTVELLNQRGDASHSKLTPKSNSSSDFEGEEKIVMSGVFDLQHMQYMQGNCLFFRVSESKDYEKPWLVM